MMRMKMSIVVEPQMKPPSRTSNPIKMINKNNIEIRVCTNRSCRKQGCATTLDTLLGIAPPHVTVSSCGCLSRCGAGPNLVVLPQAAIVSHCGTPARAAQVMLYVCGHADDDAAVGRSLDALALMKRADVEFHNGNLSLAHDLFSQAIEAKPGGGIHIAYKGRFVVDIINFVKQDVPSLCQFGKLAAAATKYYYIFRSAVRLASGNFAGALEDANEALMIAPRYAQAYISQGDAFLAMDQLESADKSYKMALEADPSVRRSKSFKFQVQSLQDKISTRAMN